LPELNEFQSQIESAELKAARLRDVRCVDLILQKATALVGVHGQAVLLGVEDAVIVVILNFVPKIEVVLLAICLDCLLYELMDVVLALGHRILVQKKLKLEIKLKTY